MPLRAKRPCNKPGCPGLTDSKFCTVHEPLGNQQNTERERWRGTAASRGYDADWQRVRLEALKRDKYLCQNCLKNDRITPATMVDHIIPIIVNPALRLVIENLQSLDDQCHAIKTAEDRKKYPQYA